MTHQIDHIIITTPKLETGMDWVEERLHYRPVLGGKHPNWGTHNALLGLGERCYLEVLAPDPSLPTPQRGRWLADYCALGTGWASWAAASSNLSKTIQELVSIGIELGTIQGGSRMSAGGSLLEWQLTDPYILPWDGYFPFLIDWGSSPHPASALPQAGVISDIQVMLPQITQEQTHFLDNMDWPFAVGYHPEPNVHITIRNHKSTSKLMHLNAK